MVDKNARILFRQAIVWLFTGGQIGRVKNLVAYELWFWELVWVEEGELPISVTAPRIISPADNQTNGFGWIEGNNIYDAGQENICPLHIVGPATQASDMDLAREEYNDKRERGRVRDK